MLKTECDLVILATPVDVDEPYLRIIAESGYTGIVTDTASTKERITKMAAELLRFPQNFVPGHPMAGSEVNGIDGARADLFQGAYWILCPSEDTPPDHIPALHELVDGLGARLIVIAPESHDRAVAAVSHVPHFVASSLVTLAARAADEQQTVMRLAAGGFKDTTRIAAGSPSLWCGIAFDNAEQVKAGLSEMRDILGAFADALEAGDRDTLTQLLKDADGLDRVRIWDLDPMFLRREKSRRRCEFAKELFRRWQEETGGEFVMDFVRKWKHLDEKGNPVKEP